MANIERPTALRTYAFSPAEYDERLMKVRAGMEQADLPVLVLHLPDTVCYLSGLDLGHSGYFAYHALIVPLEGEPVLVFREMERPPVEATAWTPRISYADTDEQPIATTKRVLEDLGLAGGRIGVDQHAWNLTVDRFQTFQGLLPDATLVKEPLIAERVRLIKSAQEVEYIRRGARAAEAGMRAGIEAVAAGVPELHLAAAIASGQARGGSEDHLAGVVGSGEKAAWLHSTWTDRRLEAGDPVKFELSGVAKHYWGRLMRTTVVGEPTDEHKRIADVLRKAQDDGISRMAPGVTAADIDDACRLPVMKAGILENYQNRVGYGLGVLFRPMAGDFTREFMPGAAWTLEAGMVFHMLTQAHGIAFSETVLVTEDGHEVITDFERELFVR
ncbi:Xaa-Pro peptidase family protein [Streptomyces sp. NPDC047070]|uniref:M24 family metallopeptidase n=1 Tax=Streptomyces sp. NPDC047070 TaxID=3154923 RepID=UPI00345668B6